MFSAFFPYSMTWWQFFADMLHLGSFFLLLLRLHSSKTSIGELWCVCVCARADGPPWNW